MLISLYGSGRFGKSDEMGSWETQKIFPLTMADISTKISTEETFSYFLSGTLAVRWSMVDKKLLPRFFFGLFVILLGMDAYLIYI